MSKVVHPDPARSGDQASPPESPALPVPRGCEISAEGGRYVIQYEGVVGKVALCVTAGAHADDLAAALVLAAAHDLLAAAKRHVATAPVFRSKPSGFEGSAARLDQEDRIATEDALRAAIAKAEGR